MAKRNKSNISSLFHGRPRGWVGNAVLVICSMVLGIVFVELSLHPFERFRPYPRFDVGERPNRSGYEWYVVDEQLGWRRTPNSKDINAQGFRNRSDLSRTSSRALIALVGDSFTYGSGVSLEETFGALVDAGLPNTDVLNLALPGFGVDQMWLTLRHVALPLEPDLIIVGLCDCDFKRSQSAYRPAERLNKPAFKLRDGRLVQKTPADRTPQPFRFFERHSRIWEAGRLIAQAIGYRFPVGEWWTLNEAILDQMRVDAASDNVPILFVYIPTIAWREFRTLKVYMSKAGANFIDLREGTPSRPESLYLTNQQLPHFNPKGHQYVARRILEWVRTSRNSPDVFKDPRPVGLARENTSLR